MTVTVATRARPKLLAERSLPSILGQTYENLEVIVVGDDADEATGEAVRALGDPRVTYRNLTQRLEFTDDPHRHWLVASTLARNEAMRLATGSWVVCFDDDDAMAPNCVERLLARAREERLRGGLRPHAHPLRTASRTRSSASSRRVSASSPGRAACTTPACASSPASWSPPTWDCPATGTWPQRMLRAGVRFGSIDEILADIYPSSFNPPAPAD